jgi:hypothetical protein
MNTTWCPRLRGSLRTRLALLSATALASLLALTFVGSAGKASGITRLSDREMRRSVGLQTANYRCVTGNQTCLGTQEATCDNDCTACTQQVATESFCTTMLGFTCTSLPSADCGEETKGVCAPDPCCDDPLNCEGYCEMSPIVTGSCGSYLSRCQ